MNNQIFSRLCNLMQGLGFGAQAGDITTAEMRAYAAGLSMVDELIQSAFANAFIDTADEYGISMLLSLLDIKPGPTRQQTRQNIINSMKKGFKIPSLLEFTSRIGSRNFSLDSSGDKYKIRLNPINYEKATFPKFGKVIKADMPVYERIFTTGLVFNFELLDSLGLNWFEIDDAALPFYAWNAIAGHDND